MYDLRSITPLWAMVSLAVYVIALHYKQARFWKAFFWTFWWQGAIFFASSACWQYFHSVSPQGWSHFLGSHHSLDFAPGGVLYEPLHSQYLAGANEVLWTGLFISLAFFMVPIVCYFYSRRKQPIAGQAIQTA